jgi:hypothetical protein
LEIRAAREFLNIGKALCKKQLKLAVAGGRSFFDRILFELSRLRSRNPVPLTPGVLAENLNRQSRRLGLTSPVCCRGA